MRIMVVAGKTRLQGRDLRATLQGKDSCGRARRRRFLKKFNLVSERKMRGEHKSKK